MKSKCLLLGLCLATPALATEQASNASLPQERPERHVILMPHAGVWAHTTKNSSYRLPAGPVIGLDAKAEPFSWLGVRGTVLHGSQPIHIPADGLIDGYQARQSSLSLLRLQFRVEPTWQISPWLSSYLGLGLGWSRFTADEPETTPHVTSYTRTGVFVGYESALGIVAEPISDWLVVELSLAASYLTKQSGTALKDSQAFTDDGHRVTLDGLPRLSMGYRAGIGVGIVL